MKRKHIAKTPPKNGRVLAIVLSAIALLLVLACLAALIFWKNAQKLHAGMFQEYTSQQMDELTQAAAEQNNTAESQKTEADWVDENGTAYTYRDDLVTVLLIGVDYMDDESKWSEDMAFNGGNADVLALAVLDPYNGELTLLYIPRDTMAEQMVLSPAGNYLDTVYSNISASHSYGDGGTLSCELTVDAVSNLLYGVPIDRYVALDYDAIPAINQLLGGVEITFSKDYTDIDSTFTEGTTVNLTDSQLMAFITNRDKTALDSAYDRGLRQMELIGALFRQCKAAFKADMSFPVRIYQQASEYITTDLSISEVAYLARQTFQSQFDTDAVITLRGEMNLGEQYAEYYPDDQWLHDFVAETFCEPME